MFLVIDGGTTNLRVTLLDEKQKPVDAVKEDGGVRHTAVDGNNQYLKTTAPGLHRPAAGPEGGWARAT